MLQWITEAITLRGLLPVGDVTEKPSNSTVIIHYNKHVLIAFLA